MKSIQSLTRTIRTRCAPHGLISFRFSTRNGELGNLTTAQNEKLNKLQGWSAQAAKTAQLAFTGQTATWYQEFQISALKHAEIGLGSSKSANANLHIWMQANGKPDGVTPETKREKVTPAKQSKLRPDSFHDQRVGQWSDVVSIPVVG